jgi:hypothetical protein
MTEADRRQISKRIDMGKESSRYRIPGGRTQKREVIVIFVKKLEERAFALPPALRSSLELCWRVRSGRGRCRTANLALLLTYRRRCLYILRRLHILLNVLFPLLNLLMNDLLLVVDKNLNRSGLRERGRRHRGHCGGNGSSGAASWGGRRRISCGGGCRGFDANMGLGLRNGADNWLGCDGFGDNNRLDWDVDRNLNGNMDRNVNFLGFYTTLRGNRGRRGHGLVVVLVDILHGGLVRSVDACKLLHDP